MKVWRGSACGHEEPVGTEAKYRLGDSEPCVHCSDVACVAVVTRLPPRAIVRIRVEARMDKASQVSKGTMLIDRRRGLLTVRKRGGSWSMPLNTVAELVVRTAILQEVSATTGHSFTARRTRR